MLPQPVDRSTPAGRVQDMTDVEINTHPLRSTFLNADIQYKCSPALLVRPAKHLQPPQNGAAGLQPAFNGLLYCRPWCGDTADHGVQNLLGLHIHTYTGIWCRLAARLRRCRAAGNTKVSHKSDALHALTRCKQRTQRALLRNEQCRPELATRILTYPM